MDLLMSFVVVIEIPKLIKSLLLAWRLEIERSWCTFIAICFIHVAVVVAPLLFAVLEGRYEAKLLEAVPLVALAFLVHAWHVWPKHGRWWWRHINLVVLKWAATVLFAAIAVSLVASVALRVRSWASLWGGGRVAWACEWELLSMSWVVSHHFHVVPLEHLEEVWWQLIEVRHSWQIWHLPHESCWAWMTMLSSLVALEVLKIASALLFLSCFFLTVAFASSRTPLGLNGWRCIGVGFLVDYDVIGNITDVVCSIRAFNLLLLIIRANITICLSSSIGNIWRFIPQNWVNLFSVHLNWLLWGLQVRVVVYSIKMLLLLTHFMDVLGWRIRLELWLWVILHIWMLVGWSSLDFFTGPKFLNALLVCTIWTNWRDNALFCVELIDSFALE